MKKILIHLFHLFTFAFLLVSCQKEISVSLPDTSQKYVVEASVNQRFQSLNYVYISKSVDYFNPDLSMRGIKGARVFITEGTIIGTDTIYNGTSTQMIDIGTFPGADTLLKGFTGIYFSATFIGKENTPYLLQITLPDSTKINGKTFIPKVIPIDSVTYIVKNQDANHDGFNDAFPTLFFTDPFEQNNYRLALHDNIDSIMLGWGSADSYRTFDDQNLNGVQRILSYNNPFKQGDTLNFYLNSIGRREFIFWQSFSTAANNGGPFATPVQVTSNINGAIGSFTGYGCSYKRIIMK